MEIIPPPLFSSNLETVETLLKNGADVNTQYQGNTLLHQAVQQNQADLTQILINHHAEINQQGKFGFPLLIAIKHHNFEIIKMLSNASVEYHNQDFHKTVIELSSKLHDRELVYYLLSRCTNVQPPSTKLLHLITSCALIKDFQHLINFEVEINEEDAGQLTPLYFACQWSLENAEFLISKGANVNHKTSHGLTPLQESIRYHTKEVYKILIEKGADVNCEAGFTGLALAMIRNEPDAFYLMLDYGVDVDLHDSRNGATALMVATFTPEFMDYLVKILERTKNINARDREGATAVHYAVKDRNLLALKKLIEVGADINLANNENLTPLAIAAGGDLEIIDCLVANGAK